MLSKIKTYFGDLARHWVLTLLLVFVLAVFLSPWLNKVYVALQSKLTFLPASKYGT